MTDEQRGYRKERPLAEIIPPDRRRLRAAALVLGGMAAGAALLAFVQDVTKPVKQPVVAARDETDIRSFSVGVAAADITSPRPGRIDSDGQTDQSFDLVVDGAVESISIASVDSTGRPYGTSRWGTGGQDWQLAVFENTRPMNRIDGSLSPLPEGTHRLHLYMSSNGSFEPGSYFRAYVVRPGGTQTMSDPLAFTGHGPPPATASRSQLTFDRGAAAAALGAVNVRPCESEPGVDGAGHVTVVFADDGTVSAAEVDRGGNEKTARGACIARAFRKARVPAFSGGPVRVGKSFTVGIAARGPE